LINLAAADPLIRQMSIAAFRRELERALALGADYLVTHPGSAKDGTVKYYIPDPNEKATGTSAAEGVGADAQGNVYGAEVGPKDVKKYVRK